MQKNISEHLNQSRRGSVIENCKKYKSKHVRCKCTLIQLFYECTKHLQKYDEEHIRINEYADNNIRTEGGLRSCMEYRHIKYFSVANQILNMIWTKLKN
jgi:hypothetical protein